MPKPVEQIKFTIESDIVCAFKSKCKTLDVSMVSVIREFMQSSKPLKSVKIKTDSRPLRKKAVSEIIVLLNDIIQMEEQYRDKIPEQFQSRFESADAACEQLSQAISCLEEAF